ncbi:glycosyltransferase [uncultured Microbacterium sp.]|uniref:Glycosyl transferase n=1 Tax=uncultured Microbacterium sp. TaxID=191216 RepID=A0A1Y5P3W3_9MICO|nr:glycosyltransferase [uncultured Microbacterium sp.]SBS73347.1 Glycosyl transferase [uncultured Microbacterium sp.]
MHVVLIPAYEPDARLVRLVRDLVADGPVVVVDDGSGPRYAAVFADAAAAGAHLVTHPRNRGKGAALRSGFAAVTAGWPAAAVVTADADGQHTAADVRRVAGRVGEGRAIVLGSRAFTGDVPARSRIGNTVTRWAFRATTGRVVHDTQTGLRGYPQGVLGWARTLPGDRFEYEFTMLLEARRAGIALVEEPIATVYLDGNTSSHFRPLADSLRVYSPLLRFAASALLAFVLDTAVLLLLEALTGWLLLSLIGARLVSAGVNFATNRRLVFAEGRSVPLRTAAARYVSLALTLLLAGFGLLTALTDAGVPTLAAKLASDATLFVVSFAVQRAIVFSPGVAASATPVPAR